MSYLASIRQLLHELDRRREFDRGRQIRRHLYQDLYRDEFHSLLESRSRTVSLYRDEFHSLLESLLESRSRTVHHEVDEVHPLLASRSRTVHHEVDVEELPGLRDSVREDREQFSEGGPCDYQRVIKDDASRKGKLPPGCKFDPTDEECVRILKKKILNGEEFDHAHIGFVKKMCEPDELPENTKSDTGHNFFCPPEKKYQKGDRKNRSTTAGYWKSTAKDKKIKDQDSQEIIGFRKTLSFHKGCTPDGEKTGWIMHEYRLVKGERSEEANQNSLLVLCRVFLKSGSKAQTPVAAAPLATSMNPGSTNDSLEVANVVSAGRSLIPASSKGYRDDVAYMKPNSCGTESTSCTCRKRYRDDNDITPRNYNVVGTSSSSSYRGINNCRLEPDISQYQRQGDITENRCHTLTTTETLQHEDLEHPHRDQVLTVDVNQGPSLDHGVENGFTPGFHQQWPNGTPTFLNQRTGNSPTTTTTSSSTSDFHTRPIDASYVGLDHSVENGFTPGFHQQWPNGTPTFQRTGNPPTTTTTSSSTSDFHTRPIDASYVGLDHSVENGFTPGFHQQWPNGTPTFQSTGNPPTTTTSGSTSDFHTRPIDSSYVDVDGFLAELLDTASSS